MKLILHDYRRCPFCIRVRILLYLKDIPYDIVNELLREWTPWMREQVKKPRVPILHVIDEQQETIMPESNDINLWLDNTFGDRTYTPQLDSLAYNQMLEWWSWCGDIFKHQIDLYKYGEDRVFDEVKHMQHTRDLRRMIQKVEDALVQSPYLLGESPTLADIALIPFIRQIMRTRNGEFDFSHYPKVLIWSGHILNEPWFDDIVMAKRT